MLTCSRKGDLPLVRGWLPRSHRFILFQKLSVTNSSSARAGSVHLISHLHTGIGFTWTCSGFGPAVPVAASSCVQLPCHGQKTVSLWSSPFSGSPNISAPSSAMNSEPCEERGALDVSFRAEHSTVSHSPHLGQLCSSVLTTAYCKQKLFWCGLRHALTYDCNSKSLGVSLILGRFSRIIVVASPRGPMVSLATGSWRG